MYIFIDFRAVSLYNNLQKVIIMQILDIMYLVLWAGLGAYCLIMARKLSPILYILGGFFAFMFIWYLVNDLTAVDMFAGTVIRLGKKYGIPTPVNEKYARMIHDMEAQLPD